MTREEFRVHPRHRYIPAGLGHHWPHTPGGESWPGNKTLILDCGSQCGGDDNTDRGSYSVYTGDVVSACI